MNQQFADSEFTILEHIYDASGGVSGKTMPLRQRDLAHIAGTSLGMTNAILKRLAQKGWIVIKRLNSRNIQYVVTFEGINELVRRSYRYIKRTIKNVVFYKDRIDQVISSAKAGNLDTVLLVGQSDLDFIVEHSCDRHGIKLHRVAGPAPDEKNRDTVNGQLTVYAEDIMTSQVSGEQNALFLSKIILESAG
ncbi:MAG: transcriptional regulator [Spirochaetaceae bacterium]|jgi:DNA-binding MarR family transcriptional regulator|nr:transcriptional regulator [Spirochaetaceae bacterium]